MVTLGLATGNPLTSSREFGQHRSLVSIVLDEGRKRTICLPIGTSPAGVLTGVQTPKRVSQLAG